MPGIRRDPYSPMNPEIKAKWLDRLRNNPPEKGKHAMRQVTPTDKGNSVRYCVLGVLCDVINPDGWHMSEYAGGNRYFAFEDTGITYPDEQHMGRAGLSVEAGRELYFMNDKLDFSFAEMADWIETNL